VNYVDVRRAKDGRDRTSVGLLFGQPTKTKKKHRIVHNIRRMIAVRCVADSSSDIRLFTEQLQNKVGYGFHSELEVSADVICSAAAARRPLFIGGGDAPFNVCRRQRRKIFSVAPAAARRPETSDPNFTLQVQYIFTILLV
jgi:hypothetical protein